MNNRLKYRQFRPLALWGIGLIMSVCNVTVYGQLTTTYNAPYDNPTYLVENVLLSTGVTVNNISFNGSLVPTGVDAQMVGFFDGSSSNLNIGSGVILATGDINVAPGPNDSGSDSQGGYNPYCCGDADLDQLAGFPTYDAAILEFDFETVTDAISFKYVFASEEYNEFVCSGYNDVFGFFISGPGITGPFSNGAINIAKIPSSNTYVGINTVNNGTVGSAGQAGGCGGNGDPGLQNTSYYVDNDNLNGQSIQYDGFTTVLMAIADLEPCQTYHIKLAVADAGDGIYDSGVFLEAASFGAVGIQVQVGQVGAPIATVVEGCDSMLFSFSRPGDNTLPLVIHFVITGSATNGVDYDFFPDSIVIPAGSSSIEFYLSAFLDGLPEGVEDINITIPANLTNNTCIDDVPSTAVVTIINTDPLALQLTNDATICVGENMPLLTTVTGGIPGYTYSWTPGTALSCTNCPNPIATPGVTTTYTVSVTDDCGTAVLSETVTVSVGEVSMGAIGNLIAIEGCLDATFTFIRYGPLTNAQTIYFTVTGAATNGTDYAFIPDSIVIPAGASSADITLIPFLDGLLEGNESVTLTITPGPGSSICGTGETTLYIQNVEDISVIASPDTAMCGGVAGTILATGSGGVAPLTYSWFDGTDTVGSNPVLNVQTNENMTYTVTVSDECGNAVAVEVVNVIITSPPPSIVSVRDSAYEDCQHDGIITISRSDTTTGEITIYFTITGTAINGTDYVAIADSVVIPAGQNSVDINIIALGDGNPETTETVIITLPRDQTDAVCYVIPFEDTVFIRNIDPITVTAQNELICPGESVTLEATASGGIGPLNYFWITTGSNQNTTLVSPTDCTIYSVNVSDTCANQFDLPDVVVDVRPVLGSVANAGIDAYEGCKNTEFTFSIPTQLPYDFTVNFDISGTATEGDDYQPVGTSIVIPAGEISAILDITTLFDGNSEGLESIVVTIIPNETDLFCPHTFVTSAQIADVEPVEIEAMGDTTMCNFTVPLSSFASGGYGPLYYSWDNNGGSNSEISVHPSQTTTYTITVVDSCKSSDARDSIIIEVDCEYIFHIPNSFTPNGDGVNDVFNAKWKGLKTYQLYIYNRWGDLIFASDNQREGWNGKANGGGQLSQQEVYVYVFETTDFLNFPHDYVGKITIIR